ncbi:MAG: hypothetical protein P9M14_09760 [Candidatus Alcyoniella australis]|nr:hypothetical protein [Candidatus Alcyoniella australis]
MRKLMIILAVAVLLTSAAVVSQDAASILATVDQLWVDRIGSMDSGKKMFGMSQSAFDVDGSYDAAWRASRAAFWVCDRTEDKQVDKQWGQIGEDWGTKAAALNPGGVEGHYYKCICLGEKGKGIGILRALTQGLGKNYEQSCNRAIAINGDFDRGGPYRAMGRYYQSLPWPKYDPEKAEENFLKSQSIPRTNFYLLELYIEEEQWGKARAIYNKTVAMSPDPQALWEDRFYIGKTKALEPQIKD